MSKSGGVFQIDDVTRTMSKGGVRLVFHPSKFRPPHLAGWLRAWYIIIVINHNNDKLQLIVHVETGRHLQNMSEQTNNSSNETTTAEPETTTTTTTPAPTVSNKVLPQVLTSMTPGSSQLVLTGVHKNNEGTYICKAHLMNLTSSDVIIRTVNISLGG